MKIKPSHCLLCALSLALCSGFVAFTEASDSMQNPDIYSLAMDSEPKPSAAPAAKPAIPEALGPVYEIAEPDLLELFMGRMQDMKASGEYDRRFADAKEKIRTELETPRAVAGLGKSTGERLWILEASIPETLPEQLLAQARETELPGISRELLFIDGTDRKSLEAASLIVSRLPETRVVLTAGSPSEASRALSRRIYFDQGGGLTRTFGIRSVPAILFNSPEGASGLEFSADNAASVLTDHLDKK